MCIWRLAAFLGKRLGQPLLITGNRKGEVQGFFVTLSRLLFQFGLFVVIFRQSGVSLQCR